MIGIYRIQNNINGKSYIGQSVNIERRWKEEKRMSDTNDHLTKSFLKYGIDNFTFSVIEECEIEELDEKEQFYIAKYNTMNPDFGYNMNSGGSKFKKWNDEIKEKISKGHIGKHHTEETKEKLRQFHLGLHPSEETYKRMCEANRKIHEKLDGNFHHTEETKRKISEAKKGKKHDESFRKRRSEIMKGNVISITRPILCIELNKKFESIASARREFNINENAMYKHLRGEKETASGYHWKRINKEEL